jgi:hypothetical protein
MRQATRTVLGRSITTLVALLFLIDGAMQVCSAPFVVEALAHTGFPAGFGPVIGAVTLLCAVTLIVPATAPLGAILTTGFMGGALCTHLRLGEIGSVPQLICILLGMLAWVGVLLADPRILPILSPSRRGGDDDTWHGRPMARAHAHRGGHR